MLIKWKDLKVGDEILITSNSKLKYLKVKKLGPKSHTCSYQKGVFEDNIVSYTHNNQPYTYNYKRELTCESDISKHNSNFYLKDDSDYRDIWLVKRDNGGV